ncbi:MAG: ATP-dependent helicase HrpB [Sporocytophaga sp.]|nr:ATP-dependent helicase HrpB [Sporocytophaga sp.]
MSLTDLPIQEIIPDIKDKLNLFPTLILQAPPGAGKSTVLPLALYNEPWLKGKKILMLEPRKLAARAVASRMAQHLDEEVGKTVGYRVRFDNKVSKDTRIEVLTEGILTRMIQQDNALDNVGLVIFDEFHERSLHADLALALCREVQTVLREDLRILIMSATLNSDQLSSLLDNAPILSSSGRQHPVTVNYLSPDNDLSIPQQIAKAVRKVVSMHDDGDILVFLPGTGEILKTLDLLSEDQRGIRILPLYGDLPLQKQQEALSPDPSGYRKIILATSIAETSLTIEGIKIVVDSGFSRAPKFDPKTGLTKLETIPVTKDAADQRAGRAGRLGPGICYRLWAQPSHQYLQDQRTPEILEADLSPTMLELINWGARDINSLSFLTPPPQGAVKQAKELLKNIDAIDEQEKITERGKEIIKLPTHPRIAHLLIEGKHKGMLSLATDLAAILEERDPLRKEAGSNMVIRIEALRRWRNKAYTDAEKNVLERIERIASSWRKTFNINIDNSAVEAVSVGELIADAYPERIAIKKDAANNSYRLANGRSARLGEFDPLNVENWLAIAHLDAGIGEGKIFLAAPVNPDNLDHLKKSKRALGWDKNKGILIARNEIKIGEIIVSSSPLKNIPEDELSQMLSSVIKSEGKDLLLWSEETDELTARLMSLHLWRTTEPWPEMNRRYITDNAEEWVAPYLQNLRKKEDFKKLDIKGIISGIVPWDLFQRLDHLAPTHIKVPSGSLIKLQYKEDGAPPILAVRLQEVFGLLDSPAVNEGRNKVILHLLSPGYKPVQITQDLKSFWQNTYQEVRKELRMRYPKHHWPEDPWTAEAVRGVKKREQK